MWLRAFLPKSALRVEEKAWNAYPYTKTRFTCPFLEKFSIEVETYYYQDAGTQVYHLYSRLVLFIFLQEYFYFKTDLQNSVIALSEITE